MYVVNSIRLRLDQILFPRVVKIVVHGWFRMDVKPWIRRLNIPIISIPIVPR